MAEDEEPGDYIEQRQDLHDCFFLVGTQKKERISTVRWFLANYSPYFRAMLLETEMKEKNSKDNIVIPDHEPDVFRLMLSFVYGRHDIRFKDVDQAMRFHMLVDRCLMPKLKMISTKYLVENCKSNLCEILECAVLLGIKEMEPRAKSIVEKDTKALLSSPDFLNANPAIVEFIVKQDGLNATEVELWRALIKWAKRQCGSRDARAIKEKLHSFIKHVQFLKMTLKEFAEEVVPTSILEPTEINKIFVNMATGKGNKVTEAPSKPRRLMSPQPPSCTKTLQIINSYSIDPYTFAKDWDCVYDIKLLKPIRSRITTIELTTVLPWCHSWDMVVTPWPIQQQSWGHARAAQETGSCEIVLCSQRSWISIASTTVNYSSGQWLPSEVLKLSDDWIVDANRNYCLRVSYMYEGGSTHSSNTRNGHYGNDTSFRTTNGAVSDEYSFSLQCSQRTNGSNGPPVIKSISFSAIDF